MKFSLLVFCGFLLVWHPGNVFVRSADAPAPPPTNASIKAVAGPTTTTAETTTVTTPAPVATTMSSNVPPGDPTSSGSSAPSSSTGPSAETTPSNVTGTGPPAASASPNATKNVSKITTAGPAISTASTATSVSPVATTSSTTVAPTVASTTLTPPTMTPATTTPATTTPATTTPPTTTPPTTTPPTTTPPTTTPPTTTPPTIDVIISETNLLLADNNFFVKLSGPAGKSLSGITLVVYNATADNTELDNVTFDAEQKLKTNGLYVHKLKNDIGKYLDTALLVLYKPGSSTGERKVMDFIIASESTTAADSVAPALKEKLGITDKLIIIVNRTKLAAMDISGDISLIRCDKAGQPDPSTLVISRSSMDAVNNCAFPNDTRRGFEFKIVASGCMEWDKSITMKLQDVIIKNVSINCQCGMTSGLFDNVYWTPYDKCSNEAKSTTNIFSGKFVGMFASQTSAIQEAYTTYVMTSPEITVGSQKFTVTNCSLLCVLPAPHIPSKDKGNISVTVAVVLSCITVFLIILVAVVIYLRRQRRGVLQFRMTRLAEDDDLEDMEDFVGGPMDDHEPSFNNSRYKASR